jgi:hypothetical protein
VKTLLVSNSNMCLEVMEAEAVKLTFAGGCLLWTGHLHLCGRRQALHPVQLPSTSQTETTGWLIHAKAADMGRDAPL